MGIEMDIVWSDDQTEWTVHAKSDNGRAIAPQDIIDGMADYFMMMGWEYHSGLSEEQPN